MTKKELLENLKYKRLNYYTMMNYAKQFITTDPYKSRLINYMLGRSKLQINFSATDMLRWFIDFTKADFLETEFFKHHGNHLQTLKAIWYESQLYPEVIKVIKLGKPLSVVTTVNEQLEEVKANIELSEEEKTKLIGDLKALRMREAKAAKREERLATERATKHITVTKVDKPNNTEVKPKKPTVNLGGHKREMTEEELRIINDLRKLNTK